METVVKGGIYFGLRVKSTENSSNKKNNGFMLDRIRSEKGTGTFPACRSTRSYEEGGLRG